MKSLLIMLLTLAVLPTSGQYRYDTGSRKQSVQHPSATPKVPHSPLPDTAAPRCHPGLWFTPTGHSAEIDGVAVGIWAAPKKYSLVVNGLNVEANPATIILWFYEAFGCVYGPFNNDSTRDVPLLSSGKFPWNDTSTRAKIRGVSISTAQFGTSTTGVGINVISSWTNEMNGLEISGMMNMHYRFNGLCLAIRNKVTYCRGMQIGVFNECREGHLIQLGLLNRIGNRRTPFINFSFKRKNKFS